jgi:hypothetical protein
MTPVDIAIEIYEELCNSSSGASQNAIQYWLQKNVGKLNNRIYTSFLQPETSTDDFLQDTGESMDENEKSIYKGLYYLRYYQGRIDYFTGAAGVQSIIELDSDGGRVKMLDKNSLSKTFITLRESLLVSLEEEIQNYINGKCSPQQVAGDDTISSSESSEVETS